MNFANVKSLVIPEGSVTQIADSLGTVLWKAVTGPDYTEPFYVENITNSDETLSIVKGASGAPTISIEYSTDKTNWSALGNTDTTALTHTLHPGDKLYLRAAADTWGASNSSNTNRINGISRVGGNVMSLLYGSNFNGQEISFPVNSAYNFSFLLTGNNTLLDASKLLLPATTLTDNCYESMFRNCTALTTAPELPATTLEWDCYKSMFYGCTSLINAPELPATTLAYECYDSMFYGCQSLRAAPELPTTTLASYCYANMFYGCYLLGYIKCLATDISATSCLSNWVYGVSNYGTFVASYNGAQYGIWAYGVDSVPQGWSAEDEYGTPFTPGVQYNDQYINVTNLGVTPNEYDSNVGTYVWPFQDVTGTDYESYKPSGTPIFLGDIISTSDSERTFKAIVTGKDEYIDSIEISVSSRDDSGSTWDYVIDVYDENGNKLATLGDYQQQTLTVSFQNHLGSSEHLYIYVKSYSTDNGYRPMFGITSVTNA